VRRDALAHEHAQTCRSLKDIIDALDPERRALLVGARADLLCDALGLRACYKRARGVLRVWGWAEVGFAANEKDGDRWAADGAYFFYPLEGRKVCQSLSPDKMRRVRR
jgi:hypothetical protein